MKIKAVLFDLDGTLLPMDLKGFSKSYFGHLAGHMTKYGYEPKKLIETIMTGTGAMKKNNGEKTNERVFFDHFASVFGEKSLEDVVHFDEFYKTDFDLVRESTSLNPEAKETVELVKSLGLKALLATNPYFPRIAQEKRVSWAGLDTSDFEYITSYEDSHFCKPNTKYFDELLAKTGLKPEECIMVGNDMEDDLSSEDAGIKIFILTDCLENAENIDITKYPHGSFKDLQEFIKNNI